MAREPKTFQEKIVGHAALVLLLMVIGGGLGYLSQTGVLELFLSDTATTRYERDEFLDMATESVDRETFRRRTVAGVCVGCVVGAGLAVFLIVKKGKSPDVRRRR